MPSVSAVVLTKDSERTIEACVKALKPAVDHVIVVDTGSFDNTVQIAKDSGARVYYFEWRGDFAAARNFGDSLATSDWVIHIDSDEILRSEDVDTIRKLCKQYKKTNVPVVVKIHQLNVMNGKIDDSQVPRMYKRGIFSWHGIIHEQIVIRRGSDPQSVSSDVGVMHDGYDSDTINFRDKLLTRNIPLLIKGVEQEPDNIAYRFFLARDYHLVRNYKDAIPHLQYCAAVFERENRPNMLNKTRLLLDECLTKNTTLSTSQESM